MAGITVTRPIILKVIVTEQFKEELKNELQEAADTAQRRLEQIDFQARRVLADLQRTDISQAMQVRQQIESEKSRQEAVIKELRDRIKEVAEMELGSEFPRGQIEGQVELNEGDNFYQKMTETEIVVKDGVIIEIREGAKKEA